MKIDAIELAWFRGAADAITLSLNHKSAVVYGENGSGKSSFVDAIEYVINAGKIGHLTHEYSGKHQEKGLINTHTPADRETQLRIKFTKDCMLAVEMERDGSFKSAGAETVAMSNWEYRRTALRQHELAEFIGYTKGEKYSALLPLLGLDEMELSAENLRQLVKSVEQEAKVKQLTDSLTQLSVKRIKIFGSADDNRIAQTIGELHRAYCTCAEKELLAQCKQIEAEIKVQIGQFSTAQRSYLALRDVANIKLKEKTDAVRTANDSLAGALEPLIEEKLMVLQSAASFVVRLPLDKNEVECPACGRLMPVQDFRGHVASEQERLREIINTFETRKEARAQLCDEVKLLTFNLAKADVKVWRDKLVEEGFGENLIYLDRLNAEALRVACTDSDLKRIEEQLMILIERAESASREAPSDVAALLNDDEKVKAAKEIVDAKEGAKAVAQANSLISFIKSLEQGIREEIRSQSKKVIDEISEDLKTMWTILHPGELIEDVGLYVTSEAEKSIDIRLKFYGVEQESPRLTLSEGYRNSLGLCIFLAMAKNQANSDCPIFLDDVVVSFDRSHRGMIVELLEKEFSDRQVIVLTHDREWYTELRQQLDSSSWIFKVLMPYKTPEVGIQLSEKTSTFDNARIHLEESPDSAGNAARKIMDNELAIRAERLKLKLPYLHRERNDHRVAHDFLLRVISDGKKCFKKKVASEYEIYSEAMTAFAEADKLLLSWGNKSSHSFDVVKNEAAKLIDICEKSLDYFSCSICNKPVYKLDDSSAELVQCQCGNLRWTYGKV